jgi:hypothetical protein
MGIEEMENNTGTSAFVLDRLFTHSLLKFNAAWGGSTITIQIKL